MVKECSICTSNHRHYIDSLLKKGKSGYEISEVLKEKEVSISKSSIYRHKKNCVDLPKENSIYQMLYETGNQRLARAIKRTQKIIKTYNYCKCSSETSRKLRRRALVWVCGLCGGWVPYNLGLVLKRRFKPTKPRQFTIVATGRTY